MVICFHDTAKFLIEEKFKKEKEGDVLDEKERMISIVGNLIKDAIQMLGKSDISITSSAVRY